MLQSLESLPGVESVVPILKPYKLASREIKPEPSSFEIAPGLVHTEEFSLRRLGGDRAAADAVYAGVPGPLSADDVAECIEWTLSRPHHVNIDQLVVKPLAQAAIHKMHRTP